MNTKEVDALKMKIKLLIALISSALICSTAAGAPELSQKMLGIFKEHSERVKAGNVSIRELLSELNRQANEGDPIAQFFYVTMGASENGFDKEARKHLQSSASNGCAGSAGVLATVFFSEENYVQGLMWLKYAAKNGDANAQYQLGKAYLKGRYGTTKNEVEGVSWILIAKDQSYSNGLDSIIQIDLINKVDLISSEQVRSRYFSLKTEIGQFPMYPCGQSLP